MIAQYLLKTLGLIPAFAILVAAIIILVRTRSVAGALLVIAQSVFILLNIFWTFFYPLLISRMTFPLNGGENSVMLAGAQGLSFLGGIAFAVGLFLLAYQHLGLKK